MIEKKDIKGLPFVNGAPDPTIRPDQARIDWIVNGECLAGADTKTSDEGSLNRVGVSVQKNITQLEENTKTIKDSLDEAIDVINTHSEILEQSDNLDLIETSQRHTDEIETLNFATVQNAQRIETISEESQKNTNEIGVVPSHDKADRNIREELEWQKNEMGSYPGFDYNGKPNIDSRGTGMKSRIINNSMAISDHNARLNKVEYNWQTSDIGALTREQQALRAEMGPSKDKVPGHSVYNRLKVVENTANANKTDTSKLNEHTGVSSFPRGNILTLVELVDSNSGLIASLEEHLQATDEKLIIVETTLGDESTVDTVIYNQKVTTKDIKDLYDIVGKSNSEGLRYSVAVLETEIGQDNQPGTVKNRILLTENGIRDLNMSVDAIQDALGIDGTGSGTFADRVTELELQVNGDENGATEFEKTGLYPYAYQLFSEGVLTDVIDSKVYVRSKDKWVELGETGINLKAPLSVSDEVFIAQVDDKIELGSAGSSLKINSNVEDLKVVNSIKLQRVTDESERSSDLISVEHQETDIVKISSNDVITDIRGQQVLINGVDVSENIVKDVLDDDFYVRTNGSWINTESPIKFTTIRNKAGNNLISGIDATRVGNSASETIIENATKIISNDLKIVKNDENIVEFSDTVNFYNPVFIDGNKVITEKDDAPNDEFYYARYKNTWAKVDNSGSGSGGIDDVPNDAKQYVRSGQEWKELGTIPFEMKDGIGINWKSGLKNFSGISYTDSMKKMSIGGTESRLEILGTVDTTLFGNQSSINAVISKTNATMLTTDTDDNLLIGDEQFKEVILRSKSDISIQTPEGKFKIWTDDHDAKSDDQIYGRKNGKWAPFTINRTQDVILNKGYSFKVVDSKDKLLTVATAGEDNLIELGQVDTLINIRSKVRLLNLDNKVHITANEDALRINLIGKTDETITVGDKVKKLRLEGLDLKFNGKRVITEDDDAPSDGSKYTRQDKTWRKAYEYGDEAPDAAGAKEGDIYFQYI